MYACGGTQESQPQTPAKTLAYQPPTDSLFAALFAEHQAIGCFVLYDQQADTSYIYRPERANTRYRPASTFKIPNTMIALELGVTDTAEVFPWDGEERYAKQWNQDLKLPQAFRYSAAWVYSIVAERIGQKRYREWLERIDYGNAEPGPDVRIFWLNGDLKISALEQLNFLRRLENGSLPFGEAAQTHFRQIFTYEKTETFDWKAKTGWTTAPDPDIGWVVGWLERGEDRYFYAMNLDMETNEHGKARLEISRAIFNSMGLLD